MFVVICKGNPIGIFFYWEARQSIPLTLHFMKLCEWWAIKKQALFHKIVSLYSIVALSAKHVQFALHWTITKLKLLFAANAFICWLKIIEFRCTTLYHYPSHECPHTNRSINSVKLMFCSRTVVNIQAGLHGRPLNILNMVQCCGVVQQWNWAQVLHFTKGSGWGNACNKHAHGVNKNTFPKSRCVSSACNWNFRADIIPPSVTHPSASARSAVP